jgi:hypothetical protein
MLGLFIFYLISVLCYFLMLFIDSRTYKIKFSEIFSYYGIDAWFFVVPLINTFIFVIWVIIKLIRFDKKF